MPEGDVMAIEQLHTKTEELTAQLQGLSAEFARLSAQTLSDEARFKLIEQTAGRHDEEIRQLKDSTRMMQLQFDQVMTKIDTLEMKLFSWLQQTQQDSVKERTTNNKQWFQFLTFVLGGTIIAIVTAVFVKGGL
ncbi:hypothetical protein A9P44_00220 [Paenibacillus polymyxa]|nr:hypothetical protein [Paenibacillus polymyxa]OBA07813.1 hypothetical protein A9P44_00220 [Paenibacillus polymyxa]